MSFFQQETYWNIIIAADHVKSSTSTALIIGIAVGSAVLVIGLMAVGIYAFKQKKRAQRAIELSKPFGNVSINQYIA